MPVVKVRFEGGAELAKKFETLSARVAKRALRDALETAGEPMRRRMGQMAPREPGAPDIANNIVISTARVKKVKGSDAQSAAVAIGPEKSFFYGFFQEFGTIFHAAQPFVRPAFDAGVTKALSDLARAMWTELAARGISRSVTVDTSVESEGPLT
jgi:HK97 gp10 family phage protein